MTETNNETSWQELKVDKDYEINIDYPYSIRKKTNKRIISEFNNGDDYICCYKRFKKIYGIEF